MPQKIYMFDKFFTKKKSVGAIISDYVQNNRKGGIPVEAIREIICDLVHDGDCKYFKVKFGKQELIIDDVQMTELTNLTNL
jgi:hypothetical protein